MRRAKPVAQAAHGLDDTVAKLAAQVVDMHVEGVAFDLVAEAVDAVLQLLAGQHPPRVLQQGRVLSSEQLKDCVYGFSDEVESNALNVHIHHLRRKLGNSIVETVRGLGYRLGPAQAPEESAS